MRDGCMSWLRTSLTGTISRQAGGASGPRGKSRHQARRPWAVACQSSPCPSLSRKHRCCSHTSCSSQQQPARGLDDDFSRVITTSAGNRNALTRHLIDGSRQHHNLFNVAAYNL